MTAPDFSRYTEAQLRQVLTRIDAAKYPERVQEIEARLADPASFGAAAAIAQATPSTPPAMTIAGPMHRLGAFLIDVLLLGAAGWIAGLFLRDQFAALGQWGQAVGFVVTLAYFGLTESPFGGGQSVGKRVLELRVVNHAGIALDRTPALRRTLIFGAACFLNAAPPIFGESNRWAVVAQSAVSLAALLSIPYLVAFNRRTRQAIHDLAAGALVVRAGTGPLAQPAQVFWSGHVAIIGAVIAILFTGSAYLASRAPQIDAASFERARSAIAHIPGLGRPGVLIGTVTMAGHSANILSIQVPVNNSVTQSPELALQVVQAAFDTLPDAARQQKINVVLRYGYDIGIARSWTMTTFTGTPDEWRTRMDAASRRD